MERKVSNSDTVGNSRGGDPAAEGCIRPCYSQGPGV